MRDLAFKYLYKIKYEYPRSVVVSYTDLELLHLYFLDENNEKVKDQFALFIGTKASDSLKYHAFYILGDNYFRNKEYQKSINYYDTIPENHPRYLASQFSKALACLLTNKSKKAEVALSKLIQPDTVDTIPDTLGTNTEEKIKIRSHIMLFNNRLRAVTDKKEFLANVDQFFQNIPEEKIRSKVEDTCRFLIESEIILLKIKELLNNKDYTEVESLLKELNDTIVNYKQNREIEGKKIESEYMKIREPYNKLALELEKLIFTSQSSFIIQKIDSLHVIQKKYYKTIKAYRSYQKDFKWRMLWNKTIEDLHARVKKTLAEVEVLLKEEE